MSLSGFDFALADAPRIAVERIGRERQPALVLDGVMARPDELVRFAADQGGFTTAMAGLYPGVRAPLPLDYVRAIVRRLDPLIRDAFGLGAVRVAKADCVYSLVTRAPETLAPFQRIPHIDTTHPLHFAALHFLCDDRFGGTAFYRQRETGFETVSPEREAAYEQARDRPFAGSAPPAGYIGPDDSWYQRTALLPARFDRLLVYRSNMLHSGHIPDPAILSADPRRGRLTANIFVGYRPG